MFDSHLVFLEVFCLTGLSEGSFIFLSLFDFQQSSYAFLRGSPTGVYAWRPGSTMREPTSRCAHGEKDPPDNCTPPSQGIPNPAGEYPTYPAGEYPTSPGNIPPGQNTSKSNQKWPGNIPPGQEISHWAGEKCYVPPRHSEAPAGWLAGFAVFYTSPAL